MAGSRAPRRTRWWMHSAAPVALTVALAACALLEPRPTAAQWVGGSPESASGVPTSRLFSGRHDPNAQMLVQANEIVYDYSGERVLAVGQVQIHYSGSILEADRVIYNQREKTLAAEGNVRLTDDRGNITTADRFELDENFRNGFIDSLHIETVERTRIAAARADRVTGEDERRFTVFRSGVYTACEPCKENPQRPPQWQVRAARVVHDEQEKTIYFEDARLEMFGVPVAYFPYFWAPDPSVKRKTGLLTPNFISGTGLGVGLQQPIFFNLAPNYDLTLAPTYLTKQGVLMVGEWRHRLINGAYTIRTAGIFQKDPGAFKNDGGDREFRGSIETRGDFRLARNWWYGWDAAVFTDRAFNRHYRIGVPGQESVSQAYLFGRGEYSYFDLRAMHFYGLSIRDQQRQLPIVHPVLDYRYRFAQPVLGGELTYNVNLASLTREEADYDPVTRKAAFDGVCDNTRLDVEKTRHDCLLRGIAGTYTRVSAEAMWRRSIVDPLGQVFTPFVWARADAASVSYANDPSMANFIDTTENSLGRITPAVGLDYRYPFISAHSWGTQIIEPRAQLIARPDEGSIGHFPNEDAQSLLFGDDNLFDISKFPGYDRVEGGGRANVAIQYTAQFNQGGYFNALFGQSYHLFGTNSYAVADMANAGINSGLETDRSDFVARMTFQPNAYYGFTTRFRFDEQTFETRRLEVEARMNFDRWTTSVTYGKYDAEPETGMLDAREGIRAAGTVKLTANWAVSGGALYSLDSDRLNAISVGLSYIDECLAVSAVYQRNYGYLGDVLPNEVVLLRLSLRTLGDTALRHTVGMSNSGNPLGF